MRAARTEDGNVLDSVGPAHYSLRQVIGLTGAPLITWLV